MRRSTRLFLLTSAVALLAPATASATKTFNPTSLSFQSPLGKESPGQTVTYSVDAAEPAITRPISPFISTPGGNACTPPPNGTCVFRFTTTCPVFPALMPPTGAQSCTFTVYYNQDTPGTAQAELHANVGQPAVTLLGKVIAGKKKKCKKKGGSGGTRRSATVAKKKCKKKR